MWVYPEKFTNVYLRLRGVHMLTSFVGSIGKLMQNSGLEDILKKSGFGSVDKILNGKKFPQNV